MSLLKEPGIYQALCMKWSVGETKKGKPMFSCVFEVYTYWNGEAWVNYQGEENQITGFFYLVKNDGNLNSFQINALSKALGWDGRSFESLQEGNWETCQISVQNEEDLTGKMRLKVAFINETNRKPGSALKRSEPKVLKKLNSQYGEGLAALADERGPTGANLEAPEEDMPF